MTSPVLHKRVDTVAVVGAFLADADVEDLIVELVQNELDAGSTRTTIRFGDTGLVCEGNGAPIDGLGWDRLTHIVGAGGAVAAKADGIGAKNHGLRTGFKLGDEILVQSAGRAARLTLFSGGKRHGVDPGVWLEDDDGAPEAGTRVTIAYRDRAVSVRSAEGLTLSPLSEAERAALYKSAAELSSRLLAAVPVSQGSYEIHLIWREASPYVVKMECGPARLSGWPGVIRRTGETAGSGIEYVRQELGCRFTVSLPSGDRGNYPRLFMSAEGLTGELGIELDEKGRLQPGAGKLRYPIAYPDSQGHAYSGYGFHISAAFVSDTPRHGLSSHNKRNEYLLKAARTAAVGLFRDRLVPRYGPDAYRLIRRPDRPDAVEEQNFTKALLAGGGLFVRQLTKTGLSGLQPLPPRSVVTITRRSNDPGAVSDEIQAFAPVGSWVLDTKTPECVISALEGLDSPRVRLFTDLDVVRELIPANPSAQRGRVVESGQLAIIAARLRVLQRIIDEWRLPAELETAIKTGALLPDADGRLHGWSSVLHATEPPPVIAGAPQPKVIHPALSGLRVLREGSLKLTRFKIDGFVSSIDFEKVPAGSRGEFLGWLQGHRERLRMDTLVALAEAPIWPTAGGAFSRLPVMAAPREPFRSLLAETVPQPARALLALNLVNSNPRSAFYLRPHATAKELRGWFTGAKARAASFREAGDDAQSAKTIRGIEEALEVIADSDRYSPHLSEISQGHETLSRSGEVRPVTLLHLPTDAVQSCELLPSDLLPPGRRRLYERLGAARRPLPEALRCALEQDPRGGQLLFRRLAAFDDAADISVLKAAEILPVGGTLKRPCDVSLPLSAELWGGWKTPWQDESITPERHKLLTDLGVARLLTESQSLGFFQWLSQQPVKVQQRHLPQIMRHLRDSAKGPMKWISGQPQLPFLPVRGTQGQFGLASYAQAVSASRSMIFAPDFPEVHEAFLASDRRLRLAVTDVDGVSGTTLAALKKAGVRSLRETLGRPTAVRAHSDITTPSELLGALKRLKSPTLIRELPKRLEIQDLPEEHLRANWRRHLGGLTSVKSGKGLRATFRFGRAEVEGSWRAGVEAGSGTIWLSAGGDMTMLFYEALASHLFTETTPVWAAYALRRSAEDIFVSAGSELDFLVDEVDAPPEDDDASNERDRYGVREGHGLAEDDFSPLKPSPRPFPQGRTYPKRADSNPRRPRPAAQTQSQRTSAKEAEDIRQLKVEHYGLHCQACLGLHQPSDLGLVQTAMWLPRFRRKVLVAHHVDHLQNQGQNGAGNLLILCDYHHALLGDALTGPAVKAALVTAAAATRLFPGDDPGDSGELGGVLAVVPIDSEPFDVPLFFTAEHQAAWSD